jgi:hypothetical protein
MIIHDFDLRRSDGASRPFETNPPLPVYADTEPTGPVTLQCFQAVAGEAPQVFQTGRRSQDLKAFVCLSIKSLKLPHELAMRERLGSVVAIA